MSDEHEQKVAEVVDRINAGQEVSVAPGEFVSIMVGDEEYPAGYVLNAYQAIASWLHSSLEVERATRAHTWSDTVQTLGVVTILCGTFLAMLFTFFGLPS